MKVSPFLSCTKAMASQLLAQDPKQCAVFLEGDTTKDGVFSPWKGQQHL